MTLTGAPAQLVKGTTDGVRNIAPLLNITRLWNGISAVALMRRAVALAYGYARKRIAFGAPLSEKPLHLDTLAGVQAEAEAAFHLAFYVAELTGQSETREISDDDALLLRLLTPVMKLTTAKQAVAVASEVLGRLVARVMSKTLACRCYSVMLRSCPSGKEPLMCSHSTRCVR